MDQGILILLKSYDISHAEIQSMINIAPMLDVTTEKEFTENCLLLIEYGYPKSDLDVLFLANPNIFIRSPQDLKNDLQKLHKKYDDIEMVLKQNPTII